MQRATNSIIGRKSAQLVGRRQRMLSAAVGGAALAAMWAVPVSAATLTWTGTTIDPSDGGGGYATAVTALTGLNPYRWTTAATNWSGGTYAVGNDVVFTDNFAGGTAIRLSTSNLNPASMTFSHIAGASPATYYFLASGDFTWNAGANSLSSSSPFGTSHNSSILLDTGFLGKVVLRASSTLAPSGSTPLTTIRSGILEINVANALPATSNTNLPNVNLAGGSLYINTPSAATGQLAGTMTVSENSILANANTAADARTWNGLLNIASGKVLTVQSINGFNPRFRANLSTINNVGTLRLDDVGANVTRLQIEAGTGGTNFTLDTGTEASEFYSGIGGNHTYNIGALTGGSGTFLSGSSNATPGIATYSIGGRGDSTTFDGLVRDVPTAGGSGSVAITKVGSGTLTLTNTETYTGATTVNQSGRLRFAGAGGSATGSTAVTVGLTGKLQLDNTTNNSNRLGDAVPVAINGGTLEFVGNRTAGTAEVVGALTIGSGAAKVINSSVGASGTASLTFASMTRGGGGSIDFTTVTGVDTVITAAPSLTNGIIGGWATVNGNDWAAMSGSNVAALGSYTAAGNAADPSTWVSTDNIDVTATTALTVATSPTVNSIKLSGSGAGLSINASQVLNIGTGGLLVTNGTSPTISGSGTITAGSAAGAEFFAQVPGAGSVLTISAPITNNGGGSVSLVKVGAGKLILGGGNTYTGGTSLLEGTIQAGAANLFTGNLTIDNNTTFDIGGFNQTLGTVTVVNGSLINSGVAASVTGTAYTVQLGTVSAALGGATTTLTKNTGGAVTLSGANTYGGGTTVSAGTLTATTAGNLGTGTLTVNGAGTLDMGTANQTLGVVTLGNSTSVGTITGTATLTGSTYNLENGTVNVLLAGTAALNKNGASNVTVIVGNTGNTYTGVTTINGTGGTNIQGDLRITKMSNGGSPSSIGQSSNAATSLIMNGGVLNYQGTGDSTDRLFTLSVNSSISGSNLVFTNTGTIVTPGGISLTLTGGGSGSAFSPLLSGSGTALQKAGSGTWRMNNTNNSYSGATTIRGGGVLEAVTLKNGGANSSIGSSTNDSFNLIFDASVGGTLRYVGTGDSTDRNFTTNNNTGIENSGTGALAWTNTSDIFTSGAALTVTFGGTNNGNNTFRPNLTQATAVAKTGTGTWTLTSPTGNTYTGATSVSAGLLRMEHSQTTTASITVTDGTLELADGGGSNRVFKTPTVSVTAPGKIDLRDNKLVTASVIGSHNGTNYTGITGLVESGRNGGVWEGAGITTSMPDATGGSGYTSLGVATGSEARGIGPTDTDVWGGVTVTGTDSLVMYTYGGDANLSGNVDIDDYGQIDFNASTGGVLTGWYNGDFDYNGIQDIDDYGVIDFVVGIQGAPFPTGSGVGMSIAAVPEPASMTIFALAGAGLLRRRRRN